MPAPRLPKPRRHAADASSSPATPASLLRRLGAAALDTLWVGLVGVGLSLAFRALLGEARFEVSLACFALPSVVNWVLLARRGQSLGKWAAGSRIERLDGSAAGLWRAVVLRGWPLLALSALPLVFGALAQPLVAGILIVDLLLLVGKDRRTLHDRWARTRVVAVQTGIPALRA
jgi:uncharacterized RDD family membrane protein YckC